MPTRLASFSDHDGDYQIYQYYIGDLPHKPDKLITSATRTTKRSRTTSASWTNTAGFISKKKSGELPVNPFNYSHTETVYPHGTHSEFSWISPKECIVTVRSGGGTPNPFAGLGFNLPSGVLPLSPRGAANADAIATSKILDKIKNEKINFAQFYAEREQTIRLISQTCRNIAASYAALRRGHIVDAGKVIMGVRPSRRIRRDFRKTHTDDPAEAASRAWLQMQYGWKPLLSDVKGAVEALDTSKQSDLKLFRCQGRGSAIESDIITSSGVNGFDLKCVRTTEYFVKYTSFHRITASATQMSTSLGLQNPAVLAWELLPYSFVVDWFLPIGEYLSSIDATSGCTFSTGSRTTVLRQTVEATWTAKGKTEYSPPGNVKYSGVVRMSMTALSVNRYRLSGFPSPKFPVIKNPISRDHALNAVALLYTSFKK